jgi:hypothetical protein
MHSQEEIKIQLSKTKAKMSWLLVSLCNFIYKFSIMRVTGSRFFLFVGASILNELCMRNLFHHIGSYRMLLLRPHLPRSHFTWKC